MKKALLIAVAILAMANVVNAAEGYIGLYAGPDHSVCNVMNPAGGFVPFEMYVFWLPSAAGMQAAEFKINYPSAGIIPSSITLNPGINVDLGSMPAGTSVSFASCQFGWTWTHHQTIYLTATNAMIIEAVNDPTALPPFLGLGTCEAGFPLHPVVRLTHLYLNQQCVYATQDATWGAIKSLF